MKIDKKKLFDMFWERAYSMAGNDDAENRREWLRYVAGLGCEIVMTPGGMLPFRNSNFVHVTDPWESPGREWHIQIPRDIALRILTIGLP